MKEDHFPIPCLNGNMVYIDRYFKHALNGFPDNKSLKALAFFYQCQRFDEQNKYTKNHFLKIFSLIFVPTDNRALDMVIWDLKFCIVSLFVFMTICSNVCAQEIFVSQELDYRHPPILYFTGHLCINCPKAAKAVAFSKSVIEELSVMAVHAGSLAYPNPPFNEDFAVFEGDTIFDQTVYPVNGSFGNVQGLPFAFLNGEAIPIDILKDSMMLKDHILDHIHADYSPVNIATQATLNNRQLNLHVQCFFTDDSETEYFLHVYILQEGLAGFQEGALDEGSSYIHHYMLRDMGTPVFGTSLGTFSAGTLWDKELEIDLPESVLSFFSNMMFPLSLPDLRIVVAISNDHSLQETSNGDTGLHYRLITSDEFLLSDLLTFTEEHSSNEIDLSVQNDYLIISNLPVTAGSSPYFIVSMNGQLVRRGEFNNSIIFEEKINISNLPTGVYIYYSEIFGGKTFYRN